MSTPLGIGRAPEADLEVRRAIDKISRVLGDLLRDGTVALNADGQWTVTAANGQAALAAMMFAARTQWPAPFDAQTALAAQMTRPPVAFYLWG